MRVSAHLVHEEHFMHLLYQCQSNTIDIGRPLYKNMQVIIRVSLCSNMTKGNQFRVMKPILDEGTRVQIHMSQYD